ncbi:MAG TPA: STAS domain-containing protein [Gaiellaceae bacterium]|nr:STAS domain-containing protein [Gaiellaceae bacterium]
MNEVLADVPFHARVERGKEGLCVVYVAGEADMHAAPELDRHLRTCEEDGLRRVVVDFTEATILDSTALGVLVAAHSRLAKQGISLRLVCNDRLIRRVLRITGLDRVFDIYATSSEAMGGAPPKQNGKGGAAELDVVRGEPGAASES